RETQNGFVAAAARDDVITPSRQETQRRVTNRGLVVDDDHQPLRRSGGRNRQPRLGDRRLRFRKRDRHLEARAPPGLRAQCQSAIKERGQSPDDREAKSESLGRIAVRIAKLIILLKHTLLLVEL